MESFATTFPAIKAEFDRRRRDTSLVCEDGLYDDCRVLKLRKESWANDGAGARRDSAGIFFAVWISDDSVRQMRAMYNVHALKLRKLRRFAVTSRDFAAAFRARFSQRQQEWPNVSVNFGPQNLMQGWISITPETFQADVLRIMLRFARVSPIIDGLLQERVRAGHP